jgi:leucyl/phenylalanyl-tRNA--protein transferase
MKNSIVFPEPEEAREDGLLAVGGDLRPARLINAYSNGIFPWYAPGEEILWWCPKERFVIFPDEINISGSMKKFMKKTSLRTKINADFAGVISNCRELRKDNTWITDEMEEAYNKLFKMGYALSVAVYETRSGAGLEGESEPVKLAGGLYGVVLGRCFFGESMFSLAPNASKVALIELCSFLSKLSFVFVDCQFHTGHLEKMGGRYISWEEYKWLLMSGRSYYGRYDY